MLIGDFRPPEFRSVAEQLGRIARIETAANCPAAILNLADADHVPDVIVLAQLWPGQHLHGQLDQLHRIAPLTRILAVSGTWCEGESRSGSPWPGMLRTYWHCWLAHWCRDFARLASAQLPAWGLPTTATDAERAMLPRRQVPATGGLIAIRSQSYDFVDMLCEACQRQGYGTVWLDPRRRAPRIDGPTAILWDGAPGTLSDLETVRATYPHSPILALVDFPRWEDVRQAEAAGAGAVLAKPFLLDDLFLLLDAMIPRSINCEDDDRWMLGVA